MQIVLVLVVVSVAILSFVLGRALVRRAGRQRGRLAMPVRRDRDIGSLVHESKLERLKKARPGVLELEGVPWERCALDGIPFPISGITAAAPRGFSHVPPGPHRIVVGAAESVEQALDLVIAEGESVRVHVAADGSLAIVPSALAPSLGAPRSFDASYIHFPTWALGPRLMLRGRSRSRDRQDA